MTPVVALAVIAAAFCHAVWNAILKAQLERLVGYMVLLGTTSALSAVGAIYYGAPPSESWSYLAASIGLHFVYNCLLLLCYRLGDISLVYPILRGTAPPIAALAGFFVLAEVPSAPVFAGILLVSLGVLCMTGGGRKNGGAIAAALLTAAAIASYSIVDAKGVRIVGNAVQYLCWLTVFDGPLFLLLLMFGRDKCRPPAALQWRYLLLAAVGGVLAFVAYGLVIYSYTKAQVGVVAALREVSVVFGALLGMYFLGEPKSLARIMGSLIIVVGTVTIIVNSVMTG